MFLKYLGKTPNFKYKGADFSTGPAEVDDDLGKQMIAENPRTFAEVPVIKPITADALVEQEVSVEASIEREVAIPKPMLSAGKPAAKPTLKAVKPATKSTKSIK